MRFRVSVHADVGARARLRIESAGESHHDFSLQV